VGCPPPEGVDVGLGDDGLSMEEQHQASQQQDQVSLQQHQQRRALLQNYDRAFSACLTGRGYSVQ
jgi:hypothetical protein